MAVVVVVEMVPGLPVLVVVVVVVIVIVVVAATMVWCDGGMCIDILHAEHRRASAKCSDM